MNKKALLAAAMLVIFLASIFGAYFGVPKATQMYSFVTEGLPQTDPALQPIVTDMQMDLTARRPYRWTQLDLDEIKAGDILIEVNAQSEVKILITTSPYQENEDCKFDYIWWGADAIDSKFIWSAYCNDFGLVEYNGPFYGWNGTNYLKATNETPLSAAEIQNALQDMRPAP